LRVPFLLANTNGFADCKNSNKGSPKNKVFWGEGGTAERMRAKPERYGAGDDAVQVLLPAP
jgi:hypothetical protein